MVRRKQTNRLSVLKFAVAAVGATAVVAATTVYMLQPHHSSRFDVDKDGGISYAEYVAGARIMFAEIDRDNDGAIDRADVKALRETVQPGLGELIGWRVWGKRLDQDGDGLLHLDEMLNGGVLKTMFAAKDKDRNGVLSPAELKLSTFGKDMKTP